MNAFPAGYGTGNISKCSIAYASMIMFLCTDLTLLSAGLSYSSQSMAAYSSRLETHSKLATGTDVSHRSSLSRKTRHRPRAILLSWLSVQAYEENPTTYAGLLKSL